MINDAGGRHLEPLTNLSRPEKSYMLLAPLARPAGKRFDMPGFRPNEHYLREM